VCDIVVKRFTFAISSPDEFFCDHWRQWCTVYYTTVAYAIVVCMLNCHKIFTTCAQVSVHLSVRLFPHYLCNRLSFELEFS